MRPLLAFLPLLLAGCAGLHPSSDPYDPAGWPAKLCSGPGRSFASTEAPLFRETGRLLYAMGDLLESPALFLEGVVRFRPESFRDAGEKFVVGTGGTLTAALNLPFFFVTGPNVDLARDADLVNSALAHMETVPPDRIRIWPSDRRTEVYPKGTRVRPYGTGLLWTIPGEGEVLQVAEESPFFRLAMETVGPEVSAQERSWGFIVPRRKDWDAQRPRDRASTIVHEFYHQHMQIRRQFMGWSAVYWPAYGWTFLRKGWMSHWAEMGGPNGAGVVDRALGGWVPDARQNRK